MGKHPFLSKTFFIGCAILLSPTPERTFAAALVHIDGTLISFTKDHYLISKSHEIYYIKRDALTEKQLKGLEKVGSTVEVAVPPSEIELVKDEKSASH